MKQIPKISESEWRVMKVLWAGSPRTAKEVIEQLTGAASWKPKTIRTLLNRLVGKKAVDIEKGGREYRYYPVVSESECIKAESRSFIRRVYGGALRPILAAFLESEDLSEDDIEDLKQIIKSKGE
jgi:BlaI family penicillinase repressor